MLLTPHFRLGVDVVEIPRFARALEHHGARLLNRIFTPAEQALTQGHIARLAARFAAKEAVVKALGTGIGPVAWVDVEILAAPNGEPIVHLHRSAAQHAAKQNLQHWQISLSHTRQTAVAIALAWGFAGQLSQAER